MTFPADDPRHGSYAGALQHWRAGEPACPACLTASRRADKRRDLAHLNGRPPMVPLGDDAHRIVTTAPRNQLGAATGMTSHRLRDYQVNGPAAMVRRASRDAILAFDLRWTPIGIQRRLRALSCLGWSMQAIADRTGRDMGSLARLRRNPNVRFVRREFADDILTIWADLHMTPAPSSHSARETRGEARRRGWLPPLAWDNIDDPDETPVDWAYVPDREARVVEYVAEGFGVSEVCRRLHLSRASFQKWCGTKNLHDTYALLCSREYQRPPAFDLGQEAS